MNTPDHRTPDRGTPDHGTPDRGTPDRSTPHHDTPDRSGMEAHLDELLAAWGQRHALTATRADEIRRAIVQPRPEELPTTWWQDLSAQVTAAIVQAGSHADRTALTLTAPSYA